MSPVLFNVFINDLEEGTHTTFVKSGDTTKLGGAMSNREEGEVKREGYRAVGYMG